MQEQVQLSSVSIQPHSCTGSLGICVDGALDGRSELLLDVSGMLLEFLECTVSKQAAASCPSKADLVLGFEHIEQGDDGDQLALKCERDFFAVDALLHEGRFLLNELLRGLLCGLDLLVQAVVEVVLECVRKVFLGRDTGSAGVQGVKRDCKIPLRPQQAAGSAGQHC